MWCDVMWESWAHFSTYRSIVLTHLNYKFRTNHVITLAQSNSERIRYSEGAVIGGCLWEVFCVLLLSVECFVWKVKFCEDFFSKNPAKMPKDGNKSEDTPFDIKKMVKKNLLLITVLSGVVIGIILGKKKREKSEKLKKKSPNELNSTSYDCSRSLIASIQSNHQSNFVDLVSGRDFLANAEAADTPSAHIQLDFRYGWLE